MMDLSLLPKAKRVLVLAVGGGNDSVSTLLIQRQLQVDFGYRPDVIDIAAMLPDCLDYQGLTPTGHPMVGIVTVNTTRSVGGAAIDAFPERILAQNKTALLPVGTIFGLSMRQGSIGLGQALAYLVKNGAYDLFLAFDVGGDFIATRENVEVLSPMMDGYALHALRSLQRDPCWTDIGLPILYGVFGLGTDGESTPEMLRAALRQIPQLHEGEFDRDAVGEFVGFYRNVVEPNRYSRTTDFTIREITGVQHDNPATFRARFHVRQEASERAAVHYGNFSHRQDPAFFGKYYLFDDISGVDNPYAKAVANGIEWFIAVQTQADKVNHELNGQSYDDLSQILDCPDLAGKSLFFGTPSRKFSDEQQRLVLGQIEAAVLSGFYDFAIVYGDYASELSPGIPVRRINQHLVLIGGDASAVEDLLRHFRDAIAREE